MGWVVVTICVALMLMLNVLWAVAYDRLSTKTAQLLDKAHQERQTLLDRIQAKDLTEYKTMTREPVPVTPREPKEIIKQI